MHLNIKYIFRHREVTSKGQEQQEQKTIMEKQILQD
jgi:hypothetical protein